MKRHILCMLLLALVITACSTSSYRTTVVPSHATDRSTGVRPPTTPTARKIARAVTTTTRATPSPTDTTISSTPANTRIDPTAITANLIPLYVSTPGNNGLNLRTSPSTKSNVVLTIPHGARIVTDGVKVRAADGSLWYRVTFDGKSGYAYAPLLSSRVSPVPRKTTVYPTARPTTLHGSKHNTTWTLTSVGDIMLGRSVLSEMQHYGDYRHPFLYTVKELRSSDLTVANLELPISDNVAAPSNPYTMSFVAPSQVLDGLKWAGIDGVSLANNHTMSFGQQPLVDTTHALNRYGIKHFGGGANIQSAYAPAIFNVRGLRVAFLGFDDIYRWQWSNPGAPGIATAWKQQVHDAIVSAQKRADVVIAFFHWGVEYTAVPTETQIALAHLAIDSGANLVLGSHPHWVQPVERYRGRWIIYSMGNFVFDQMWSAETRQGVIVKFTFRGSQVIGVRYLPTVIYDYNQPRLATGYDRQAVLRRMQVNGPLHPQ